ncbi:hypothetical protein SRB5_53260 [Streptomyces sp. RB5]|uniref:DUF4240 domain-containing protein n=1 Tax=Streptomyces smaragdinus TaxID=2585196 RepID=A0A7K0CNU4_9ACTN|nr:DUF4240 domain-containing protein [Streptomyces smaragdinus]MQY15148.1 hypothetical protein [Streptomyces smaragdinus]
MDTNEFWQLIDTARANATTGKTVGEALVDLLADRSKEDILGYQERFDEVYGALCRWDTWAAAYLIGGGCSDDSFSDFCAGLVAQGRDWYVKVLANPDSLAEHPVVTAAAAAGEDMPVEFFAEDANFAAVAAYERLTGDEESFWEDWDTYRAGQSPAEDDPGSMGEDFDFDDPNEMHRRLPRLAALCLPPAG